MERAVEALYDQRDWLARGSSSPPLGLSHGTERGVWLWTQELRGHVHLLTARGKTYPIKPQVNSDELSSKVPVLLHWQGHSKSGHLKSNGMKPSPAFFVST